MRVTPDVHRASAPRRSATTPILTPRPRRPSRSSRSTLILTGDLAAAEAVRKAHIGHEASIKSIGLLHYLGAFFVLAHGGRSVSLRSSRSGDGWGAVMICRARCSTWRSAACTWHWGSA